MPNESSKRWNGLGAIALTAFAVLMLYVLSIGPYWRVYGSDDNAVERFTTIYAPIHAVCGRSDAMATLFKHYVNLWIPGSKAYPIYWGDEITVVVRSM